MKLKRNLPRGSRQISPDPSGAVYPVGWNEAVPLDRYRSGPQSPLFQWRLNVRLIGLLLAGMLVSTGVVVAHAIPLGSDLGHRATMRAAGMSRYGTAVAGLASRARSLESVPRYVGSAALRP
jgi:hypothetical protein